LSDPVAKSSQAAWFCALTTSVAHQGVGRRAADAFPAGSRAHRNDERLQQEVEFGALLVDRMPEQLWLSTQRNQYRRTAQLMTTAPER
jgi:hypothetical protein